MTLAQNFVCRGMLASVVHNRGPHCRFDGKTVTDYVAAFSNWLNVEPPMTYIKDAVRGHGRHGKITIPHWLLHGANDAYIRYYIAHEVAHHAHWMGGHGPVFKRLEGVLLKKMGLGIRYLRAYPKALYTLGANGECEHAVYENRRPRRRRTRRTQHSNTTDALLDMRFVR